MINFNSANLINDGWNRPDDPSRDDDAHLFYRKDTTVEGWIDTCDCEEKVHVFKRVNNEAPKVYHSDDHECLECEYKLTA